MGRKCEDIYYTANRKKRIELTSSGLSVVQFNQRYVEWFLSA